MNFFSNFWETFWFIFLIFIFVAYLIALFAIIGDLFRDRSVKGIVKALWVVFLIFVPFITALLYLIVRGRGMSERNEKAARANKAAAETYIREVAATSPADEIDRAQKLLENGTITAEEFANLKAAALRKATE